MTSVRFVASVLQQCVLIFTFIVFPGNALHAQPDLMTVPSASVSFPDTDLDDPPVTQQVQIENSGDSDLVFTDIRIVSAGGDFRFSAAPDTTPLPASDTRIVTIEFAPTASGPRIGLLIIESNDPGTPILQLPLSGIAVDSVIDPSATAIDFGPEFTGGGPTPDQPITIQNTGTSPLEIEEVVLQGADPDDFVVISDSGETTLAPGAIRTISIAFSPLTLGNKQAILVIRSTAADGNKLVEVELTGEAIQGPFVVSITPATAVPTNEEFVEWIVEFNRAVEGVDISDFQLTETDLTGSSLLLVTNPDDFSLADNEDEPDFWIVRAQRGALTGANPTLLLELIDDDTIEDDLFGIELQDELGQPDGSFAGDPFDFDFTAPLGTISAITASPTDQNMVEFNIAFTEPVSPTMVLPNLTIETTLPSGLNNTLTGPFNAPAEDYSLAITPNDPNEDGQISAEFFTPGSTLVTSGLIALYEFDEAVGDTAADSSGFGAPLNVTATNRLGLRWIPGGGLEKFLEGIELESAGPATKIYDAIAGPSGTNELTVEVLIRPADLIQTGPARILTMSDGNSNRNFTLGQTGNDVNFRLRTTTNNNNGNNPDVQVNNVLTGEIQRLSATRSADGTIRVYIDGGVVTEVMPPDPLPMDGNYIGGDLSNWEDDFAIAFGDEFSFERPWNGSIYQAAIYSRALTEMEIRQNFEAGQFIRDTAGNDFVPTNSGPDTITIDNGPPALVSITRDQPERTNAGSVSWTVRFNDDVTGVDIDSFSLIETGDLTGSVIQLVDPLTGPARQYTVIAFLGSGDMGTIQLSLTDPSGITDAVTQPLTAGGPGEIYTIDREAPEIVAIRRVQTSPSRRLTVDFEVEFTEPVTKLDETDFDITETNQLILSGIVSIMDNGGGFYTVTVNTGEGDGELVLALDGATDIADLSGPAVQSLISLSPSVVESYEIDKNQPPVDITLSNTTLIQDSPAGTVLGTLSAIDFDFTDSHTFDFAPPFSDAEGLFEIVGNEVRLAMPLDDSIAVPLLISVSATDDGADTVPASGLANLSVLEVFTLSIIPASSETKWMLLGE